MVKFNELRITAEDKYLVIDASVDSASYFENITIQSIVIDTKDTFKVNGPSGSPVYVYEVPDTEYQKVYTEGDMYNQVQESNTKDYCYVLVASSKKHIRLILNSENLNAPIKDNMFFVYVITSGEVSSDTPKELIKNPIVGVVVNLYPIYKEAMCYTKQIKDKCNISRSFVDYILKVKALDVSIKTGNFIEAIKYWNKLFKRPLSQSYE